MSREPIPLTVARLKNGAAQYTTLADDEIDHLCWRHYGREWETTEATLLANPGLAARGPVLPGGVLITFPYIETKTPARKERRRLFD